MKIFSKKTKIEKVNKKRNRELRSIIAGLYGNNVSSFAKNYAMNSLEIPEVRNAVEIYSNIFSTVPMYHKRIEANGNVSYIADGLTNILTIKPNPLQNASQFWTTVVTQWIFNGDVFIEPIFDPANGKLKYLYCLPSSCFTFGLQSTGAYVTFYDMNGSAGKQYNLKDLIYLNRHASTAGGAKINLGIYEQVLDSLQEQAINVADPHKVRAIIESQTKMSQLKEKDRKGIAKAVNASFDENVKGLAYLDGSYEITPVNWNENDVNQSLMQTVINTVDECVGIPRSIINCSAQENEVELFLSTRIYPICLQFEQELTSKLFTPREIQVGNRIELDQFALHIASLQSLTAFISIAIRNGVLSIDEAREKFGYAPLENGQGKDHNISLDMISSSILNEYKMKEKSNSRNAANKENKIASLNKGGNYDGK